MNVEISESKGPSVKVHGRRVHRTAAEIRIDRLESEKPGIGLEVGGFITVAGVKWAIDGKMGDATVVAGPEVVVVNALQDADAFILENSEGKKITIERPNITASNATAGIAGDNDPFRWQNQPAIVGPVDIMEVRTLGFAGADEAKRRFVFSSPPADPVEFVEPETKDIIVWNGKNHTTLHIQEQGVGVWAVFCNEGVPIPCLD